MAELVIGEIPLISAAPEKASDILIGARRLCPEVQLREREYGFAPEVHVVRERTDAETWDASFYQDYELTALWWSDGADLDVIVLGFYAEGDFRPLDPAGKALEELDRIGPLTVDDRSPDSRQRLRQFCEANAPSAQEDPVEDGTPRPHGAQARRAFAWPERIDTPAYAQEWKLWERDKSRPLADLFEDSATPIDDRYVREAQFGTEGFYESTRLVQVLPLNRARAARAGYLLLVTAPDTNRVIIVNGADAVHEANSHDTPRFDTDERVEAYLRFFCWHTGFVLPRALREIPFPGPPMARLRALNFSCPVLKADAPLVRRSALLWWVATASRVYSVDLQLNRDNGYVSMLRDLPIEPIGADEVLAAEEVAEQFLRNRGRTLEPEGATRVAGAGAVTNALFRTPVDFDQFGDEATFRFHNCVFARGIAASRGSFEFTNCTIRFPDSGGPQPAEQNGEGAHSDGDGSLILKTIAIDLSDANAIGALRLTNCLVEGELRADHIRTKGDVRIEGCHIIVPTGVQEEAETAVPLVPEGAFTAISLRNGSIGGDLRIVAADGRPANDNLRTEIHGDLAAEGLTVSGVLACSGTCILGTVNVTAATFRQSAEFGARCGRSVYFKRVRAKNGLDLSRVEVESDLSLKHATVRGPLELLHGSARSISLEDVRVDGPVDLRGCETTGGDLSLQQVRIDGSVNLDGAVVGGDLSLKLGRIRGLVRAVWDAARAAKRPRAAQAERSLRIEGNLDMSGADIKVVEMRGIKVGGALVARMGTFERLIFAPGIRPATEGSVSGSGVVRRLSPADVVYNELGAVSLRAIAVEGHLDLSGARVTTPADGPSRKALDREADLGCAVTDSRIGGHLVLSLVRPERDLMRAWGDASVGAGWLPDHQVEATVEVKLDLSKNTIGGELRLQNVRVDGRIDLSDSKVGRDVRIGADAPPATGATGSTLRTRCESLSAEMLRCEGDVDLTGLDVTSAGLSARGATVAGDLLFSMIESVTGSAGAAAADKQPSEGPALERIATQRQSALIKGGVDLSSVSASRLVLAGANIVKGSKVILERGRFDRLEILTPTPDINLSQLTVRDWGFGTGEAPGARQYCGILEKMKPFDRSVWLDVESSLRQEGQEEVADAVYRAMRRREREEHAGPCPAAPGHWSLARVSAQLRTFVWHLKDRVTLVFTGYGTRLYPLGILWTVFLCASVSFFMDEGNVRASTAVLQVSEAPEPSVAPSTGGPRLPHRTPGVLGEEWSRPDAFALALRYQVPMAQFITHDRWEASDRTVISGVRWLTAERWAFLTVIVGWLTLPIILIHLAAKAVRGVKH